MRCPLRNGRHARARRLHEARQLFGAFLAISQNQEKRAELNRLIGAVERRGYAVIPTRMYWKHGRAKLEIALGRGKKQHDKRSTERDRDWAREKERLLKTG